MENVACAGTGAKEPKGKQPPCRLTPLGNSTSHAHLHVGSEKKKTRKARGSAGFHYPAGGEGGIRTHRFFHKNQITIILKIFLGQIWGATC
jgi:hypothetical protein